MKQRAMEDVHNKLQNKTTAWKWPGFFGGVGGHDNIIKIAHFAITFILIKMGNF